ncbi:MAG: flagellar biosynthesis protein FlhA [Ignavibacteria bacterium]|nr:flagellar biosynthesis protein FlhA [Ignavibacteria bacterium]
MKLGNFAAPIIIVAIILAMIIPVPPAILDLLIVINISITLIMLLNTAFLKTALDLSSFPSMLVITTVFRLAISVKALTLILGEGTGTGKAGVVIAGFGSVMARGSIVVGAVLFSVLMIVNFLVITRGAERVAEVAARFTLDAMPGKQMAIDADLNSGLINDSEAKERRRKIQREADFYGAMDGASKFVKSDAIASILIAIINIVGGLIIGMAINGEPVSEAINNYTILSIGDGLVSLIPSIMISVSTAMIVTRAGSDSDLSQDLIKQMFSNPNVLFLAAGVCFVLYFIIPMFFFIIMAIALVIIGYRLRQKQKAIQKQEEIQIQESEIEDIRKPENVVSLLQVDPIELEFGYGIIPLADVNQGGDLLDRVVMIRRQLALELGMIVPIIRLRDNIQLSPNEYVIKIKGVEIAKSDIMLDHFLAMNPGMVEEELDGIKTTEPAFGLPAIWLTESQRDKAEMYGYTVVDPPSIISTHLTEVIKKFAHELTGRQEIQKLIDNVKLNYPAVVEELVPKVMSIGEIQKIIANLLKEGVSIRDMVTILETLADNAVTTHDPDLLTEYVRQALGRAISKKFINETKSNVITLDPKLEQIIMDSLQRTEHGSFLTLEPDVSNSILNNLTKQLQKLMQLDQQPVILASPVVRLYFKRLTEQTMPGLTVLSYNELDPNIEVQSVGMVNI